jgi:hypothetical protein
VGTDHIAGRLSALGSPQLTVCRRPVDLACATVPSGLRALSGSPIKGDVKRYFSPLAGRRGCFRASSPSAGLHHAVDGRGPLAFSSRDGVPLRSGFMLMISDDAIRCSKPTSVAIAKLATMVLSETLGLKLSGVVRGGIGLSQRLGAE